VPRHVAGRRRAGLHRRGRPRPRASPRRYAPPRRSSRGTGEPVIRGSPDPTRARRGRRPSVAHRDPRRGRRPRRSSSCFSS
jgi:hypothetical protein